MKAKSIVGLVAIVTMILSANTIHLAGEASSSENPGEAKQAERSSKGKNNGKVWMIKAADSVDPEIRKLFDGKLVHEGLNAIQKTAGEVQISLMVRSGELAELVFTDRNGRRRTTQLMARKLGGGLGSTSGADCRQQYDRCLDNCRAEGGLGEYLCNLFCAWDLGRCLASYKGSKEGSWLRLQLQ